MNYPEEQKAEFRAVFAARRRRQTVLSVLLFLFALVAVFLWMGGQAGNPGIPRSVVLPAAIALVGGTVAFSLYNWRCPACKGYLGNR